MTGSQHGRARVRSLEALEARHLLAGDLVSQWLAEDLNASVAEDGVVAEWTDSIGSVSAAPIGSPTLVANALGGRSVVRFDPSDGDDGFRVRASFNPLASAGDFSLAVAFATASQNLEGDNAEWFRNSGLVDSSAQGFSKDWGLSINAAGQISAGMGSGFAMPTATLYSTASGLNDGQTHVVLLTRSGSELSLYVDDQPVDSRNDVNDGPRAPLDLTFGVIQSNTLPFAGDIAEIRVYDGALTAGEAAGVRDEIASFYSNQAPVAVDDSYSLDEDELFVARGAQSLLANDTDADGDPLTPVVVDDASHGTVTILADGGFIYNPDQDYFGEDSFTYTANDFRPGNVATVTLTIAPLYDPPAAVADRYEPTPGQIFNASAGDGVLVNDRNPDNLAITALLVQDAADGTVTLNDDGSFSYDPGDFSGTTTFTYRAVDGVTNDTAAATVTLVVNSPPAAVDDQYSVPEDEELVIDAAGGVLGNDSDREGDALTLTVTNEPVNGTLTMMPDGSFSYAPFPDFFGDDQFTYVLNDGLDDSREATARITVQSVNDVPVAVGETYLAAPGEQLSVAADTGLLSNEIDVDGPALSVILVQEPTRGTLTLQSDGSFTYDSPVGATGLDSFSYRVTDTIAESNVAIVSIIADSGQPRVSDPTGDTIVTFNELMYNPAGSDGEWIELRNQMGIDMDISGWRLSGGVAFAFPEGTVIPGNSHLVIAAEPDELMEAGVENVMGPFVGRLDNGGEEIQIRNNSNRIMDILNYGDRGAWPVGPDASGATLSKHHVHTASGEAASWTTSAEIGGTPGTENFPVTDLSPASNELIGWSANWRYDASATDLGTAWREADFNDQGWQTGEGLFQAGDPGFPPVDPGGLDEPGVGLVGYWPLDEQSGSVAANLVEGGADGELSGPRWNNNAERGRVLRFDGINDYVAAGELPAIGVQDDFTWSFWFNQDEVDNANAVIVGNRSGGNQNPLQFVKFTPTKFEYYSDAGNPFIDHAIPDALWQHLAVVKSGPTFTYYVNGDAVGSGETTADMGANPFFFGGDPDAAGEFADGFIDDVAVWNRDLPVESIMGLASGQFNPLTAPTVFADGPLIPDGVPNSRTDLPEAPNTYYFRNEFEFFDDIDQTQLKLTALIDDGAVIYLNGQEVHRQNLPGGPIAFDTAAAQDVGDIGASEIVVPANALARGKNLLAVEIHQAVGAASDMFFGAELIAEVPATDRSKLALPVINEITAFNDASFTIEIANHSDRTINLLGYSLIGADDGEYDFADQTLAPGAFMTLDRAQLGFRPSDGERVFLLAAGGTRYVDGQAVSNRLQGRSEQHDGRWMFPSQATLGAANQFAIRDEIVINEIQYHAPGFYAAQIDRLFENNEQWIELYNRSDTETVDLSGWQFTEGIEYVFPAGTTLGPDQYLVVSGDPTSLLATRPNLSADQVLGPFSRNLSNAGELVEISDQNGNLVDWVRYYDGGRWDKTADARGATLELRDPFSDNNVAEAWAASDESQQVAWQTITYAGPGSNNGNDPRQYNEFLFGLLDDGELLIDDIQVIENPGTPEAVQLIQNGNFEGDAIGSGPAFWRLIGTQSGSVVQDPDDPNNQVLHLKASGPTEHMHNQASTTLKSGDEFIRIDNGADYEISYRAKWVAGSNQLNTRLYFNRLPVTTRLDRPIQVGTPGQPNSQRVDNAGPTYQGLIHAPAVPDRDQPVTVSVSAHDADGLRNMVLWYAVDSGDFVSVPMSAAADGTYEGIIPGLASSTLVQLYVEGTDNQGATTQFPADGADSRALYRVQDNRAMDDQRHNLRILMTDEDTDFLHESTNVMSNHRIGATVIYNESEIFYDVGVRLKGSQRGRDKVVRAGFNIGFDPAQLFRGVHGTIGVDRSGSGDEYSQEEIIVRQVINHAGNLPQIYDDLIHVIAPRAVHTGSAMLNLARYNDVFLDSQYESGSQGTAFEYELIYYPTSTVDRNDIESLKRPNPDSVAGVPPRDLGDDKELYRWHWLIKNNRQEDDYSQLMETLKALGRRSSDVGFHEDMQRLLDVDQWLRSFAVLTLTGIGDNYGSGSQHNGIFYARPSDNRVLLLPWDMDFSFTQGATSGVVNNGELRKLIDDPGAEHNYYGHLYDMIQTTFNREYMDGWIDHFDQLVPGQAQFQSFKNYIGSRADAVIRSIERAIDVVPFEITTADPQDVGDSPAADVEGTGWVDVREVRLQGQNIALPLTWTTENTWRATVPVGNGTKDVVLEAYDFQGNLVTTQSITITSTAATPVRDWLRVSELQFNPAEPVAGEPDVNNDDFEFIEVMNVGSEPIDLAGVQFVQVVIAGEQEGITFSFDSQILQPQQRMLVVQDRIAFQARYGDNHLLAEGQGNQDDKGQYSGRLGNGGETVTLIDATGAFIQQFTYDDAWYTSTDGDGFSLEFIDPTLPDLDAWNQAENWEPSGPKGGTPGTGPVLLGDSNFDGVFNSADLVLVGQAGEYEDGIPDNSTWAEGDWNGDGDFDSADLVAVFKAGHYVSAARLAVDQIHQRSADIAAATDLQGVTTATVRERLVVSRRDTVRPAGIRQQVELDARSVDSLFNFSENVDAPSEGDSPKLERLADDSIDL